MAETGSWQTTCRFFNASLAACRYHGGSTAANYTSSAVGRQLTTRCNIHTALRATAALSIPIYHQKSPHGRAYCQGSLDGGILERSVEYLGAVHYSLPQRRQLTPPPAFCSSTTMLMQAVRRASLQSQAPSASPPSFTSRYSLYWSVHPTTSGRVGSKRNSQAIRRSFRRNRRRNL